MKYFAYGSNMNPERMRERNIYFSSRNHATLKGFRLEFNKVASRNSEEGYANIVLDKDGTVEGILYDITNSDLIKLDRYEGYPDHYNRVKVNIIVIAIAAVIIWQTLPRKETVSVPTDSPSLAVLYFTNNTGDKELDHWSRGLSDMLIDDLSQSKYIYVLPKHRLLDVFKKFELLEVDSYSNRDIEKLESWGVGNYILLGNYFKSGDNFRISVTLHNVNTGEDTGTEQVEGNLNDVFGLVDELTVKIKMLPPV